MTLALQKLLSYLWDVQIDYRFSEINGDLVVFLVKGRYQLCTANAIYSFETKYANFGNIFQNYIDINVIPGNRVLIAGLGLGSVPQILDELRPKSWNFDAIEIDPEICELAALYGYHLISSPIQTHILDASLYMQLCKEKYDLVCLDLFIDDEIPESCISLEFLQDVRNTLSQKGLVIANTLAFSEKHKKWSKEYFTEKFKAIFPKGCIVHTHKNYMLISNREVLLSPNSKEVIA